MIVTQMLLFFLCGYLLFQTRITPRSRSWEIGRHPTGMQDRTPYKCDPFIHERERYMFYLTTHSTHFIYGYMAVYIIWLRTIQIVREETRCRRIGYSYRLIASVILYAPSHRQDNAYHGICYTSREALAGTRNSSMGHMKDRSDDPPHHERTFIHL